MKTRPTAPKPRAALYLRISSDKNQRRIGVEDQRRQCEQLCLDEGFELVATFEDNDKSAAKRTAVRPDYDRMVAAMMAKDVDVVVTYAADRFQRHPGALEAFMEDAEAASMKRVVTVREGRFDLTNPDDRRRIRDAVINAAWEVERMRQRQQNRQRDLAEQGMSNGGGLRSFGWVRAQGVRDGTVHDEAEAELIREAATRVLANEAIRAIAIDWNARGIPTVKGGPWSRNSVLGILTSPRNAGLRQHKPVDSDETVLYPADWPEIIARDEWDRLQQVLKNPARRTNGGTRRSYLLSGGLVRCGLCGVTLIGKPLKGKRSYMCSTDKHGGCGKVRINAEHLEGFLVPLVLLWVDDPSVRQMTLDENNAAAAEIARLTLANAEDGAQIDTWQDYLMTGAITPAKLRQHRKPLDERMALRIARDHRATGQQRPGQVHGARERELGRADDRRPADRGQGPHQRHHRQPRREAGQQPLRPARVSASTGGLPTSGSSSWTASAWTRLQGRRPRRRRCLRAVTPMRSSR